MLTRRCRIDGEPGDHVQSAAATAEASGSDGRRKGALVHDGAEVVQHRAVPGGRKGATAMAKSARLGLLLSRSSARAFSAPRLWTSSAISRWWTLSAATHGRPWVSCRWAVAADGSGGSGLAHQRTECRASLLATLYPGYRRRFGRWRWRGWRPSGRGAVRVRRAGSRWRRGRARGPGWGRCRAGDDRVCGSAPGGRGGPG